MFTSVGYPPRAFLSQAPIQAPWLAHAQYEHFFMGTCHSACCQDVVDYVAPQPSPPPAAAAARVPASKPKPATRPKVAGIKPEFQAALASVCLSPRLIQTTGLDRVARHLQQLKKTDAKAHDRLTSRDGYESALKAALKKAYPSQNPTQVRDLANGVHLLPTLSRLHTAPVAYAMHVMVKSDAPDTLLAKLSEAADRAHRCHSAQMQARHLLLGHASRLLERAEQPGQRRGVENGDGGAAAAERRAAQERFEACFEALVDEWKQNAFASAFVEPARCYFDRLRAHHGRDHVNVHGLNWYLVLLNEAVGFRLPLVPHEDEPEGEFWKGLADHWAGLDDAAWDAFAAPANFGKGFKGIAALKRGAAARVDTRWLGGRRAEGAFRYNGGAQAPPTDALRGALRRDPKLRAALAVYVERFCSFFSAERLAPKAFEILNAESRPELAGVRGAMETLYAAYRAEHALEAETLVEHVYADEYYTALDGAAVRRFLGWTGVLSLGDADAAELAARRAAAAREVCPICAEPRDEVAVLPHWQAHGDVSEHKMCGACLRAWGKNECPFCKEVLQKEELLRFISSFAQCVRSSSAAPDPNVSAALLEQVQLFEMEHEASPRTVARVYKTLAEDATFARTLDRALGARAEWLKDMAGVVLRLHAMACDGELPQLGAKHTARLAAAVECIFRPFEGKVGAGTALGHGGGNGHYYGALYMQCAVPFLCAWRAGTKTDTLRALTLRAGKAIVRCFEAEGQPAEVRAKVAERAHREYVVLVSAPVWGAQDKDPILKTFF